MQSVLSRSWTRVAVSISYDDNDYTTGTWYHRCLSPFFKCLCYSNEDSLEIMSALFNKWATVFFFFRYSLLHSWLRSVYKFPKTDLPTIPTKTDFRMHICCVRMILFRRENRYFCVFKNPSWTPWFEFYRNSYKNLCVSMTISQM